jgi:hypothetical protein
MAMIFALVGASLLANEAVQICNTPFASKLAPTGVLIEGTDSL